jgi:hypothetical protein
MKNEEGLFEGDNVREMSDKNKDWEECMLVITYSLYLKIT